MFGKSYDSFWQELILIFSFKQFVLPVGSALSLFFSDFIFRSRSQGRDAARDEGAGGPGGRGGEGRGRSRGRGPGGTRRRPRTWRRRWSRPRGPPWFYTHIIFQNFLFFESYFPVGDDLDSAVRERDPVLARHHAVLVLNLLLGKICSGISILRKKTLHMMIYIWFILLNITIILRTLIVNIDH